MNNKLKWIPLAMLCVACGGPDSGRPEDVGGNTGNEGPLARYVSGSFTLSEDTKYDKLCNVLDEGYVGSIFDVEHGDVSVKDGQNSCEFWWGDKKHVVLSTTGYKAFPSTYQAEAMFDSLYQTKEYATRHRRIHRPSLFGPSTEGTVSEGPAMGSPLSNIPGNSQEGPSRGADSTAAAGDTTKIGAGNIRDVSPALVEPPKNSPAGKAVTGIGDKAIWSASTRTLHILSDNHIFHIMVDNGKSAASDLEMARQLASVVLDKAAKEVRSFTQPD
ncbi:hypothetical protein [Tellurirhabdus bombi]|uniref:hypothetical protein n=1 Tax=Tellurirhabdus bombi TaxID=2907205 RepID=UPI001F24B70D|nr:hypothetical protein [Tellurirhabdus bombi]